VKGRDQLNRDNWQAAAIKTVERLPGDILASVGYKVVDAKVIEIRIAAPPLDGGEHTTEVVTLRWWDTMAENRDHALAQNPGLGLEGINALYDEVTLAAPMIDVDGPSDSQGERTTKYLRAKYLRRDMWQSIALTIS
jgi:hypothetical protein